MGDLRENWTHEKVITHRFGFLLIVTVLFTVGRLFYMYWQKGKVRGEAKI